ncbi:hypothetical protein B0H67DRAFT_609047 [Lasiosphaeris hirsuta]|uniref:Uncharacterized protein n=1 Tax=Lasiosphaeris hirsuta TaxID=260670 RepID=A0AA40AR43_9PEZI|nr:hypothetical protein B0H67DRAFT_609047 [Lasiosphaeris hirsuta]
MPSLRGIEVSVMVSNGPGYSQEQLPEYPHPDGSSVQLAHGYDIRSLLQPTQIDTSKLSTKSARDNSSRQNTADSTADNSTQGAGGKPYRQNTGDNSVQSARYNWPQQKTGDNLGQSAGGNSSQQKTGNNAGQNAGVSLTRQDARDNSTQRCKTNPQTSVYILAPPGKQFQIKYTIRNVAALPCRYMLFRLSINTQRMLSWGRDLAIDAELTGSVATSFWIPHGEYGNEYGMEGKSFVFLPDGSMPHDGGCIEVHVFRASSRKARYARLEEHKPQQSKGILTPSIGLVNKDGDIHYGDKNCQHYELIDSLEAPFAVFKFHYRPVQPLGQLNLVPPHGHGDNDFDGIGPEGATPTPAPRKQHALETPPIRSPLASVASRRIPTSGKAAQDAYLQRPLPQLPRTAEGPSSADKRTSVMSVASIAPSLAEQTSREPYDSNLQLLEAKIVRVQLANKRLDITLEEDHKPVQQLRSPTSCYEISQPSTAGAGTEEAVARANLGIGSGEEIAAERGSGQHDLSSIWLEEAGGAGSTLAPSPCFYVPERAPSPFAGIRLGEQRWVGPTPPPIRREELAGDLEVASRGKPAGRSFFERLRWKYSHSPEKMAAAKKA